MALYNTSIDYANFWEGQLSDLKVAGWILVGLFFAALVLACVPGGQGASAFLFTTWGILLGIGAAIGVALLATAYIIEYSDKYKDGLIQRDQLIDQINNDSQLTPAEKERLKQEARTYHGIYKPDGWAKLALSIAKPIASIVAEASDAADATVKSAGHVIQDAGKAASSIADSGLSVAKLFNGKVITFLGLGIIGLVTFKLLNGAK